MQITDRVTELKGVGPKKAEALARLKIRTIEDFLSFYPRDYEDRRNRKRISDLREGEAALICGKILSMAKGRGFGKKRTLRISAGDGSGTLEIIFFGAAYLEKTLSKEAEYEFFGKVTSRGGRLQMVHPDFRRKAENEKTGQTAGILPVYPLTEGISQSEMRKWMEQARCYKDLLNDYVPEEIRERNRLCGLSYAVGQVHFPEDGQKLRQGRFRLIFDEFFLLQLGLLSAREASEKCKDGIAFDSRVSMEEFYRSLPFPLTAAQKRVTEEIEKDMESGKPMNRLVQGDVGSGKTAVAAGAIYKAVCSGYQAVMMAPTELLARQHFESLSTQFAPFAIRVGFLSGGLGQKARRLLLEDLAAGRIDLLIGTHALIQEDVAFSRLGLVITDEQHRFGVNQRALLSQKGKDSASGVPRMPDVLVMTATPIPRTLAFVLYGDLDVSVIDELPPGRKPILTEALDENGRDAAYKQVRRAVSEGRQVYVVAPLIEDSDSLECRSASGIYEEIQKKFPDIRSALLHGAMNQKEKDGIMEAFSRGEIDVLVSTVVIEVGINVPNAALMVIENAERFGLAQLHQLRGRVGRGSAQSRCILLTQSSQELAVQRAELMASTGDGFLIAEKDLEMRGPGEFFGVRQHGLPELKLADICRHRKVLDLAREEAKRILEKDPGLRDSDHALLLLKIKKMFDSADGVCL